MTSKQPPQLQQQYLHNDLFRPASPGEFNACVGMNGGPYDFREYALGYFEAGSRIASSLLSDRSMLDLLIYPLVFTYRHGIKLSLKDLADQLPTLWGDNSQVIMSHRLSDNWDRINTYLKRCKQEFDPGNTLIDEVDTILKDFLEIDQTGEVFRYPTERSGSNHLEGDVSHINVVVFAQAMHKVSAIFEFWMDSVRVAVQNNLEVQAQA
jgi:hypothetical protein